MAVLQSDVLIIGGGLAGIVTALECLRAGKRVTLVDRDGRVPMVNPSLGGHQWKASIKQNHLGHVYKVQRQHAHLPAFLRYRAAKACRSLRNLPQQTAHALRLHRHAHRQSGVQSSR